METYTTEKKHEKCRRKFRIRFPSVSVPAKSSRSESLRWSLNIWLSYMYYRHYVGK